MSIIRTIVTNTDVASAARKVLLSVGSITIAKYVPNPEIAGGLILLLGSILQAWSKYDDQRIKRAERGPEGHHNEHQGGQGVDGDGRSLVSGDGMGAGGAGGGEPTGVRPHDPPGPGV